MPKDNPFQNMVVQFAQLLQQGKALPAPRPPFPERPALAANAPRCLIFSPHPDDEVIIGALPLRLLRQSGFRVCNVAVTLGSRRDRRRERLEELEAACDYLGFDLLLPRSQGFDDINPAGRRGQPRQWRLAVERIVELLEQQRPTLILMPHAEDWNQTHIGTHLLVQDALEGMPSDFGCHVVETEFWGAMDDPNLLVESTAEEVADLMAALSLHRGEVARNPYHLRLMAWMVDNVRRGAELVGGAGGPAPDFAFATCYRLSQWRQRRLQRAPGHGRSLARADEPTLILSLNHAEHEEA